MIKKTVTYTDFNGKEVTEDLYFNLSAAELVEMEVSGEASMADRLRGIVNEGDRREILAAFKQIVLDSYGKRSEDGSRFIKTKALREDFEHSPAFSEVLLDIMMDTDNAAEFVNGIMPQNLRKRLDAAEAQSSELGQKAADALDQGNTTPQPTPEQIQAFLDQRGKDSGQSGNAFGA